MIVRILLILFSLVIYSFAIWFGLCSGLKFGEYLQMQKNKERKNTEK